MAVPARRTIAFAIGGPIAAADLPGLCDRVCTLLERSGAAVAVCDVSGIERDAVTVDALARLQLAARRHGCQVRLRNACSELLALVAFMGLSDVLPEVTLRVEMGGKAEQREQARRVEEEHDSADSPV